MEILKNLQINDITIKNRIAVPPMCTNQAIDGYVNDEHIITYGMYGRNQFGLVIVEATSVLENGVIFENDLRINDDSYIEGLTKLSSIIKKHGSVAAIQLGHAGRKGIKNLIAPSKLRFSSDFDEPKEMTLSEIITVENAFVNGAKRAKKAGFDLIELHAAHGYLLNQFLSPLANKRNDEYGGSLENRMRLLLDIIKRINEEAQIPITLRISAEEYHSDGNQFVDFVNIINAVKKEGIEFISISSGGVIGAIDYGTIIEGYQVHLATSLKKATQVNVGCVGLISRIEHMEDVIKNNESDIIFVGRHTIKHPTWFMNITSEYENFPYPYSRLFVKKNIKKTSKK